MSIDLTAKVQRPVPLVGRKKEYAALQKRLDQAQAGRGATVVVFGGTGLGKTRLVEEIEDEAAHRDMLVLRATASRRGTGQAYGLFAGVLAACLPHSTPEEQTALRATVAAMAPHLWDGLFPGEEADEPEAAEMGDELRQNLFLGRLGRLLAHISQRQPLLLCLENLQWADSASLHGIRHLTDRNADKPFLIVGTCRPPGRTKRPASQFEGILQSIRQRSHFYPLRLEPMAAADIRQLLESCFGPQSFNDRLVDEVQRKSGGVPLFVMEYLEILRDRGVLHEDEGHWQLDADEENDVEVPESIRAALHQRLAGLDEEVRHLLGHAAIQGDVFQPALLVRTCGQPPNQVLGLLEDLVRKTRLIRREGEGYRFAHSMLTESFYQFLPDYRRRQGHLRLATAIEDHTPQDAEGMACHFFAAEAYKAALPHLLKAARREQSAFAYGEAQRFLDQAETALQQAEGVPMVPNRLRILLIRIDLEERTGRPERVLELCTEALELAAPDQYKSSRAHALLSMGAVLARKGTWTEALQFYRDAQELFAQLQDPTYIAVIDVRLGTIAFERGDLEEATACLRRAKDEAVNKRNFALLGTIFGNLGIYSSVRGRYREAVLHYTEALKAYRRIKHQYGLCQTYHNLGLTNTIQQEWSVALQCYAEAEKLAQDMGTFDLLANILVSQAPAQLGLNDVDGADQSCKRARTLMRQVGDRLGLAECDKVEGMILSEWTAYDEAEKRLRLGRRRFNRLDNKLGVAECSLELGRLKTKQGQVHKARTHLLKAHRVFSQIGAEAEAEKAVDLLKALGHGQN